MAVRLEVNGRRRRFTMELRTALLDGLHGDQ